MLHDRGLVHLDVKPANVLITRTRESAGEHVYLADFGLTRRGAGGHRTAGGDFLGSPSYASPEHLRGAGIGPASDEYSMTCMLFAALAGRPPYVGDVRTVVTGHLSGVVPSLSALADVPPALDRVIARGLAGDPSLRYQSISDLLTAVRRAIADGDDAPAGAHGSTPSVQRSAEPDGRASSRQDRGHARPPEAEPALLRPSPVADMVAARPPSAGGGRPFAGGPAPAAGGPSPAAGGQPSVGSPLVPPVPPPLRSPMYPPLQPSPHSPGQLQLRPQFVGAGQHRPAAHRIEPARSRWPWLLGIVVAALIVVVVVLLVRSTGSESLRPAGSTPAAITAGQPSDATVLR